MLVDDTIRLLEQEVVRLLVIGWPLPLLTAGPGMRVGCAELEFRLSFLGEALIDALLLNGLPPSLTMGAGVLGLEYDLDRTADDTFLVRDWDLGLAETLEAELLRKFCLSSAWDSCTVGGLSESLHFRTRSCEGLEDLTRFSLLSLTPRLLFRDFTGCYNRAHK